jgi:hypothetical protein
MSLPCLCVSLKLSANALTLAAGEVDLPTCGVSKRESWYKGN